MFKIRLGMFAAIGAALLAFAPTANAATYYFTGTCSDCLVPGSTATGTLVLQNYTETEPIIGDNFLSFEYLSDKFSLTVIKGENFNGISGSLGTLFPSPYEVRIFSTSRSPGSANPPFVTGYEFSSFTNGDWIVGPINSNSDFGTNGVWGNAAPGQTPIPGAAMLFGSVFAGAAGFGTWRRRRKAA